VKRKVDQPERKDVNCPDCNIFMIEFHHGSGMYHCGNPNCKFQYFDKNTGKKYRKEEK
jgi:hypothetical protein